MKRVVLIIICIFLLIIDTTILPYYAYGNIFPSLLFTFSIGFSIINGKNEAVAIGVLSGFLQDLFFGHGFGVNMLINMLLCYGAARIGEGIYKDNRIIPVITCLIMSLLKVIGVIIVLLILDVSIRMVDGFISAVLNAVVMILMYKLILKYSEKYFPRDAWRFR